MKKGFLGGQALMEGVLILFRDVYAVAVQTPEGIRTWTARPRVLRSKLLRVPLLRGVVALFAMVVIGTQAMLRASQYASEEDEELSTTVLVVTAVVSFSLALLIFGLAPLLFTVSVVPDSHPLLFNLLDGLLRVAAVVVYIVLIAQMSEIKRMFEYHGAEHKVINAYEQGDLSLSGARAQSRFLGRCSTTFVVLVLLVAILLYSLVPLDLPLGQLILVRGLLLFPIAGLSYELVRFSAGRDSWYVRWLLAPGFWLQRLTVREPSDDQLRVALAAVRAVQKASS